MEVDGSDSIFCGDWRNKMKKTLDAAAEICHACDFDLTTTVPVVIYCCGECGRIGCLHVIGKNYFAEDIADREIKCIVGGCAKRGLKSKQRPHA